MSLSAKELSEKAWELVEEAITSGTITLPGANDIDIRKLETEDILDLAKWLSASKLKARQDISTPEDFSPPETKDDGETDYEQIP